MRRVAAALSTLSVLSAVAACSLLTSLDGYSDGEDAADARSDTEPDTRTPVDGGRDTAAPADGGDSGDATPTRADLYAQAVMADKPLGYWRLEETSGTVAKDETGRYDGIYVDGPTFGVVGAAGSGAIKLAADSNARMQVGAPVFRFPGTAPYSVELWAKPGQLKNYQWLSGTEGSGAGGRSGWSLLADSNGGVRYEVWRPDADGGSNQVRGVFMPSPIPAAQLHHIVVTYSGTAVVGYIDGAKGAPFNTSGVAPDTGFLTWAGRSDVVHCLDDWVIDELAIYDAVLPEARVTAHFDLGK